MRTGDDFVDLVMIGCFDLGLTGTCFAARIPDGGCFDSLLTGNRYLEKTPDACSDLGLTGTCFAAKSPAGCCELMVIGSCFAASVLAANGFLGFVGIGKCPVD